MNNKHDLSTCRLLLLAVLVIMSASALVSCGNDEPSPLVVDYYMNVEEGFLVDGSTDHTDRYFDPWQRMQDAIRQVYPTPNVDGNDEAVLEACDKEYATFVSLYAGQKEHMTCMMHLMKALKRDGVVKQSEKMMTYIYDINPTEIDE